MGLFSDADISMVSKAVLKDLKNRGFDKAFRKNASLIVLEKFDDTRKMVHRQGTASVQWTFIFNSLFEFVTKSLSSDNASKFGESMGLVVGALKWNTEWAVRDNNIDGLMACFDAVRPNPIYYDMLRKIVLHFKEDMVEVEYVLPDRQRMHLMRFFEKIGI
jgi:hypothetical protein